MLLFFCQIKVALFEKINTLSTASLLFHSLWSQIVFNLGKSQLSQLSNVNKVPTEVGAANVLISPRLVNAQLEALYSDAISLTGAEKVKLF